MRILLLNANLSGVGTYHRALWFARMLADAGHECTVCTVSRESKLKRVFKKDRPGVEIIEGPNLGFGACPGKGSNIIDIFWRSLYLARKGFDVTYAFEYHPNVYWPVYMFQGSRRLVSDWCDLYAGAANVFRGSRLMHRWDASREARIRRRADMVTVISDFLGERTLALGIPKEKCRLIREGVDTGYMRPFDRLESRRRLGLPEDSILVTTLQDGAAFPNLVKSVAELRSENPKVGLLFVGGMREEQKRLAHEAGLDGALYCTGRCSDEDLPRNLCAGDLAALPMADSLANRSRFPHKIGDYLACGLPVALTAVGEYPELLKKEGLGAVANGLQDFTGVLRELAGNADRRQDSSVRGRKWVVENLDWQVLKPEIVKCVEENN